MEFEKHGGAPAVATPGPREPARWLRVPDAASHLGIGLGTLNKLRTYGGGPKYAKVGAVVIYDAADLDAWATDRKVGSTSERVRPPSHV